MPIPGDHWVPVNSNWIIDRQKYSLRDLFFIVVMNHRAKNRPTSDNNAKGAIAMIRLKNMDSVQPIYSQLACDPEIADIVDMFVSEIPGRVEKMLRQLNEKNWDELQRTAHQLKGSAGSYGFEPLSPSAHRVEQAIRNGEPEETIRQCVVELIDLCGQVRCGRPE